MGTTLDYRLRLPGELSEHAVFGVLSQLRVHALTLSLPEVSPIFRVEAGEPTLVDSKAVRNGENFFRCFAAFAIRLPVNDDDPFPERSGTQSANALGFTVHLGDGAELAVFGFVAGEGSTGGPSSSGPPKDWYWNGWCRTHYFAGLDEDHFVGCHVNLVALLDAATAIGIRVEVVDELDYWESRDLERLRSAIRRDKRTAARYTSALADRLDPDTDSAALFVDHPDFQHLEMEDQEEEEDEE
jgi:hypothetical protein